MHDDQTLHFHKVLTETQASHGAERKAMHKAMQEENLLLVSNFK